MSIEFDFVDVAALVHAQRNPNAAPFSQLSGTEQAALINEAMEEYERPSEKSDPVLVAVLNANRERI